MARPWDVGIFAGAVCSVGPGRGGAAASQMPAAVELQFSGRESSVTRWGLPSGLQGSTWSRECTLTFTKGFSWAGAGHTFWHCLALLF